VVTKQLKTVAAVQSSAVKILNKLAEIVPTHPLEGQFRHELEPLLDEFCREVGVSPIPQVEYTLATGRADAVFNRLVIEYEHPGVIEKIPGKQTEHSILQVKNYMEGIAEKERHRLTRLAGIVFDGVFVIFVRYMGEEWIIEKPVEATSNSIERMLTWLASLSSGIALTSENLTEDFSIEQPRTQEILSALYDSLDKSLRKKDSLVSKLFEQWKTFFSESIDYSEAFGGEKLKDVHKWVRKGGIQVKTGEDAERFFFALHTYFALLAKFLGWLALSRELALKIGAPSFGELVTADSSSLRDQLEEMEHGGIFRKFGVLNLLEGDFFLWYLHAWSPSVEKPIRNLLTRLDEYDPSTLTIVPEETRDLFKKLYHYLLPREIRHNLGEYYTPDWLAHELLNQVDPQSFSSGQSTTSEQVVQRLRTERFLDPACGSGTFLVLVIARFVEVGKEAMIRESDVLDMILGNVYGFDLNPLAVLTSRVNYVLSILDLLEFRKRDITIPVYIADSVRTPSIGEQLFTTGGYVFRTAVGNFVVPEAVCTKERFDKFCDRLDQSVEDEVNPEVFIDRIQSELALSRGEWDETARDMTRKIYDQLVGLHGEGLDGLWARLLKNNFAPLTVGQFDCIIGNPPWINWEHLPDDYRTSIKPIWERYGLFPHGGMDTILGKGKKDISTLMLYTVIDNLLKDGGRLGFVITQSVFKTGGAGQGFRHFRIPKPSKHEVPLKVVKVEDMVDLKPFEGATNRTALVLIDKGSKTEYPVPFLIWRRRPGKRFGYESSLDEVIKGSWQLDFAAEPVNANDETSAWLTASPDTLPALRKVLGGCSYEGHAGVYTGGANGVYWLEVVALRAGGLAVVKNLTEGAKIKVRNVSGVLERTLLYPLLRGRDVQRWSASPSATILMVQDPEKRQGIDEKELQRKYPNTHHYLKSFEEILRSRAAFKRYFTRKVGRGRIQEVAPFYSMFDVGEYSVSPWKVVWRYIATDFIVAVVGTQEDKPILPNEKLMMVACASKNEAHYLCGILNSSPIRLAVRSFFVETQIAPHVLSQLAIPRFDSKNPLHIELANLSIKAHTLTSKAHYALVSRVEEEVDEAASSVLKLKGKDLVEIKRALSLLIESEPPLPAPE
jgi:SAM-dependent methyltransferase